ncbi:MAG: cyclase family protein [Smithellaceae bacterium]
MSKGKRDTIIDLTKPLDTSFIPFSNGQYTDPSMEISEWSTLQKDGFRVSRLSMGTQSGTHIDAPAHFLEDGARLEALSPAEFIGKYFLLNLSCVMSLSKVTESLKAYRNEEILLLKTPANQTVELSVEAMQKILSLPPLLLVLSGKIEIMDSKPFSFNRLVAEAAKFLVEDLDPQKTNSLLEHGEIFIFPLNLMGVPGSPCRVLARI